MCETVWDVALPRHHFWTTSRHGKAVEQGRRFRCCCWYRISTLGWTCWTSPDRIQPGMCIVCIVILKLYWYILIYYDILYYLVSSSIIQYHPVSSYLEHHTYHTPFVGWTPFLTSEATAAIAQIRGHVLHLAMEATAGCRDRFSPWYFLP